MPKRSFCRPLLLLIALPLMLLYSCNQVKEVPPPTEFAAFPQPKTYPLELTDPKPLHWDTLGKGKITPTVFHLDFEKLPAQPYDPHGFKPLPAAPATNAFDYSELPSQPFDLEKIPKHPLEMKAAPLPLPTNIMAFQKPARVTGSTLDMSEWQQFRLSGVAVYGLVKNAAGMLFIGTSNGIYQFDGTGFSNLVPQREIFGMAFDKAGNLWFASSKSFNSSTIYRINLKEKILESCEIPTTATPKKFTTDQNGCIWIPSSSTSAPLMIDPVAMTYRILNQKNGMQPTRYYNICHDAGNRTWLCSRNGIDIIDREKKRLVHLGKRNGLSSDTVTAFANAPDGRIWVAGQKGVDGIDLEKGSIIHYSSRATLENRTFCMHYDKAGQLWLAKFASGMDIINSRENTIRKINTEDGFPNGPVLSIEEYENGQILAALLTPGTITSIEQYGKTVYPLKATNIIATTEDSKGNLWVGTENELLIADSMRKNIWRLGPSQGLTDNSVQSITEKEGKVILTTNKGFNIYDPGQNELLRVGKKEGLLTDTCYSVTRDMRGNLWTTGTADGIVKYQDSGNYILGLSSKGGLNGDFVVQAIPYDDTKMIINTYESGLCIIDQSKNTVRLIGKPPAFNSVAFKTLLKDSKDRLWLAGDNNWGIYAIDLKAKTITQFTTAEGLSDNSAYSVLEYNGKILACLDQKVNIITPPELSTDNKWEISVLNHSDDFAKQYTSFASDAVAKRGNYLIGDAGLRVFYNIEQDTSRVRAYVTGVSIMGKEAHFVQPRNINGKDTTEKMMNALSFQGYTQKGAITWDSLDGLFNMPVKLSLPFDQNVLQFQFTELSSGKSDSLNFGYVLEGQDNEWTFTNDTKTETYLNLSPGEYKFKVASQRTNGKWNVPSTFSFTIQPPWYFTWWAYVIYILLFVLLTWGFIKIQKKRVLAKERQHSEMREAQLKAEGENERRKNIELISEMGKDITSSLSIKNIINTVYGHVNKLMDAAVFGVGIFNKETRQLNFPATVEKGEILPPYSYDIDDKKRPANWCFKNKKEIVMNDFEKEHRAYIPDIPETAAGQNASSLIYLPLIYKDKPIGVLTAQSFNKDAYNENHLNILRSLATYTSVALDNAEAYRNLQATQSQLIQSEKMASLGELTAGIAHEIQNPLNFVNNFSEVNIDLIKEMNEEIEKGNLDEAKALATDISNNEEKIIYHGRRADSIVKSMLQHSRNSSGNKEATDINNLCDECLRLAFHGMRAKDKSFNSGMETDFDPTIEKVNMAPQDMGRVLLNLLTNAFYEVNEKSKSNLNGYQPLVKIGTKKSGDTLHIEVADNGSGFSEKVKEKIFQPFFTTKPTGKGTGLGLSLSYDIIKAHGGDIQIESSEGEGAQFIIHLPLK